MSFNIFSQINKSSAQNINRKLIRTMIGGVLCAVDIMCIKEITNPAKLTIVPNVPFYVKGVTDHRNQLMPVIDLRLRLGLSPDLSKREKWIIVEINGQNVALLVDEVLAVTTVTPELERERHPLVEGSNVDWALRVYGGQTDLMFELDIENLISFKETNVK